MLSKLELTGHTI